MASNAFGNIFKIITWGESHGKTIGVVIDGCPAGLELSDSDINTALQARAPGMTPYTSPRKESDKAEILSGVFEGKTTGAPISIVIPNIDADSSKYTAIKDILRPGHANYTYLEKYGIFDYRGGGRSSARETACRVAAGAVANKFLHQFGIHIVAYIKQIGSVEASISFQDVTNLRTHTYNNSIFCPDEKSSLEMITLLEKAKQEGDSMGGIVEFLVTSLPVGLGDPMYEKLEAKLASAMLSIPASKGFEIGSGFKGVLMSGSDHNDLFINEDDEIKTKTNNAGGILGGISTGMPIHGRVAFKPTSSILKVQESVNLSGEKTSLQIPAGSRHDPCVAIRAVPVVEAMLALVIRDAILLNRCVKL